MAPSKKAAPKPAAKLAVKPKSNMTVWPAEHATPHTHNHEHNHSHDHAHGTCCGHTPTTQTGMLCCLTACCPIAKIVFTRSFWAASVVAFFIIFATDWLLHTKFLMQDYAESSSLWRNEGEIRHSLIFITQALTAMVYAAIVIGMGYGHRWFGSFTSGVLASAPMAISAMLAYNMLPFATNYIPTVWGIAALIQGGLAGLAICASLHISRTPDVTDCCPPKSQMH